MVYKIIRLKINVTKIDKAKLFKGEKGTYLDCTLLYNSDADQYGNNGMIIQDATKEEREAGNKGAILGNAKEFKTGNTVAPALAASSEDDNLPF